MRRAFLAENRISGEILHTPGHSEDSISLILEEGIAIVGELEEGIAIVGDLYPLYSVPAFNDKILDESWNYILERNLDVVYYGHAKEDVLTEISCITDIY